MHKESSPLLITKNEQTVEAMTKVIVERMTNPFIIEEGTNEDNRQPLINTFTKTTALQDVTDCLLKVRHNMVNKPWKTLDTIWSTNLGKLCQKQQTEQPRG